MMTTGWTIEMIGSPSNGKGHMDVQATSMPTHGIQVGNLIYLSGQMPLGDNGKVVAPGDLGLQTAQCFRNIEKLLRSADSSLENVVKLTTYFTRPLTMSLGEEYWEARAQFFLHHLPASTGVQVCSLLDPDALLEVEAVAIRSAGG